MANKLVLPAAISEGGCWCCRPQHSPHWLRSAAVARRARCHGSLWRSRAGLWLRMARRRLHRGLPAGGWSLGCRNFVRYCALPCSQSGQTADSKRTRTTESLEIQAQSARAPSVWYVVLWTAADLSMLLVSGVQAGGGWARFAGSCLARMLCSHPLHLATPIPRAQKWYHFWTRTPLFYIAVAGLYMSQRSHRSTPSSGPCARSHQYWLSTSSGGGRSVCWMATHQYVMCLALIVRTPLRASMYCWSTANTCRCWWPRTCLRLR